VIAILLVLGFAGQPVLDDPSGRPFTSEQPAATRAVRPAPAEDHRHLYVIGGLAVLALAFLWNRRHRAELDREADARRGRRRGDSQIPIDDPDAADLRAAARGEEHPP
jgi:hypothetical protein